MSSTSALAPGSSLAHYRIAFKLGEGGMGEVWSATDTRLGREVAIKVLPAAFTEDRERLARFEREARLLAQLNHPNIAQIYGLETSGETRALIMELVPGPTLAERLESGPLSFTESLSFALQIAHALEEAHEKGIVHRDLKPQNVKASGEGKVKVLDFGLAKAMDASGAGSSAADLARSPTIMNSPTLTAVHGTQLGVILGTAAYMAPEQARGSAVDKRADIWAFGVVLWEMLTGRSLFAGPTVSDTLAGVLKTAIEFDDLPPETPPAIRRLLRRCLERNPKNRLHDIADARVVLEEVLAGKSDEIAPAATPADAASRPRPGWRTLAALTGILALGLAGGLLIPRGTTEAEPEMRFPLALPEGWKFADGDVPLIAMSRDGRRRAVTAVDAEGNQKLLVGEIGEIRWQEVAGTAGAQAPFFSPDGQWLGFFSEGMLRRIAIAGGPSQPMVKIGIQVRGAAWLTGGSIVYSPDAAEPLWVISEEGGEARQLTTLRPERKERTHRWPHALPGGKAVLFTSDSSETTEYYDDADIEVVVIATGERKTVLRGSSQARYFEPGFLIFARGGALFATGFDPVKLQTKGTPVPVLQGVTTIVASGATQFAVADSGALLWVPGEATSAGNRPLWVDRSGNRSEPLTEVGAYTALSLSPDGKRLALVAIEGQGTDIWILDLEQHSRSRLTFDGDVNVPVWSPDSKRVAYLRTGRSPGSDSDIYWKLADGSGEAEPLVAGPERVNSGTFSPDGRFFAFDRESSGGQSFDIWTLSLDAGREQRPFQATDSFERGASISPDGKWIAYLATDDGRTELFVRPFPSGSGKWQVSSDGATEPHWSVDGKELFFRRSSTLFRAAIVTREGRFAAGVPEKVAGGFRPGNNLRSFSPGPDGSRFVALPGWELSRGTSQVNLALHWDREVQRQRQLQR